MNKAERIKIAQENILINKRGWYINPDGERIIFKTINNRTINAVDLYSPQKSASILKKADEIRQGKTQNNKCKFALIDADSYNAAEGLENPLVMNFANAHRAGGGFLYGASAQEEALCRTSTLYASICSRKAAKMYEYNNQLNSPVDSDYFLISPNVAVYRYINLTLRHKPFNVSVVTIAAPDRLGSAKDISNDELKEIMTVRLQKMLYAAAENDYRSLVLGAWGCGAFGNDPVAVASIFYQLFFDEEMSCLFDNVVFAVLGGGNNYAAFKEVFGDKISDCNEKSEKKREKKYIELSYDFPMCHHSTKDENENIGYSQGVLSDGVPFEAELWKNSEGLRALSVILPELDNIKDRVHANSETPKSDDNYIPMYWEEGDTIEDCSILHYGLRRKEEMNGAELGDYVDYLTEMGVIHHIACYNGGFGTHFTDFYGNKFVNVVVTLSDDKGQYLETELNFRKFHRSDK